MKRECLSRDEVDKLLNDGDVITMAKACGLEDLAEEMATLVGVVPCHDRLVKFAEMVVEREREECAKACEQIPPEEVFGTNAVFAKNIRMRSNAKVTGASPNEGTQE